MAQINKSSDYFNTVLYTGNGSTQSISGVNFTPDWLWIKERSSTSSHFIYDVIRGVNVKLSSNTTDADSTVADSMTSFDSDGFTVGNNGATNESGQTVVAWNWLAGGTASSNTDGSITSQVSANTTSGFSIVSYTGTGANATVGHGLGVAPAMIIVKNRTSGVEHWQVLHQSLNTSAGQYLLLSATNSVGTASSVWNSTEPTSSVFSVGTAGGTNGNTNNLIAYCFAEKKGYSKFGSFTGNGNADGTFVYTGFKPAFIITKLSSGTGSWFLHDNKRNGYNGGNNYVYPNGSDAELTTQLLDITSNGFKMRFAGGANSSGTSIYMAFAENPLVGTNNIPATAR